MALTLTDLTAIDVRYPTSDLLDGSDAAIRCALDAGSPHGYVAIAAWNARDEIVLTGAPAALAAAAAVVPSRPIPVAGAWHSPAMNDAVEELRAALHAAPRRRLACPLLANRDGLPAAEDTIPDLLAGVDDPKLKANREKLIGMTTEKMSELAPPAREQLRGYLRMLDDQLAGKDFFLGGSFTMADASLYHPLYFLGLIPPNFSIVKDFANVNRWFERIRDLA